MNVLTCIPFQPKPRRQQHLPHTHTLNDQTCLALVLAVLGGRGGVSGGPSIGGDTSVMVARLKEAAAQIAATVLINIYKGYEFRLTHDFDTRL